MTCPDCDAETVAFGVPPEHRPHAPGEETRAAVCTRCLAVRPTDGPPDDPSALAAIGEGVPDRPDAAVPLLLAVDRLSSFALHRAAVEDLLDAVERAGVDPLVALDRLTADPDLDPAVDLDRRRAQVEQLRS